MKTQKFLLIAVIFLFIAMMLSSCFNEEDPGPLQEEEKNYTILDFERLEMGDAFVVTVQQSSSYSIRVRGDRRNIDDLEVKKVGSTLKISYDDFGNRDHTTYIDITMPVLEGVNFSGATNSTISGFMNQSDFDIVLSGASICQLNMESQRIDVNLSGASRLNVSGKSPKMIAKASGASELYGYPLITDEADVDASGASLIKVFANSTLKAVANGASEIYYRGNASVSASANGASVVKAD